VAGLGIAVRGFTPTRVHTLNRKVLLGRLTVLDLSGLTTTIGLMILGAWIYRSVWALLIGSLAGDVVRVALSYRILPGHKHRLLIDKESVREIVHVGRWIVVSTSLTYAVGYLDRMVIGRMLSIRELGIYAIAFQIVQGMMGFGSALSGRVLFPILAETLRERPALLRQRLRRARLMWILPTVAGLLVLCFAGGWFVRLVYKPNYYDAGWMLRILAAGSVATVINQSAGVVWPTLGEFRTIVVVMVAQIAISLACMFLGFALYGTVGFVVGVASVGILLYPLQSILIARRKLWQPEVDLPVLALAALIVAISALVG
jgi:O-antigen/teichoic acid export membrane protein